jgi:hypothetical protein
MASCAKCKRPLISGVVLCEECRVDHERCDEECPRIKDYSKVKAAADRLPIVESALRLAVKDVFRSGVGRYPQNDELEDVVSKYLNEAKEGSGNGLLHDTLHKVR